MFPVGRYRRLWITDYRIGLYVDRDMRVAGNAEGKAKD